MIVCLCVIALQQADDLYMVCAISRPITAGISPSPPVIKRMDECVDKLLITKIISMLCSTRLAVFQYAR